MSSGTIASDPKSMEKAEFDWDESVHSFRGFFPEFENLIPGLDLMTNVRLKEVCNLLSLPSSNQTKIQMKQSIASWFHHHVPFQLRDIIRTAEKHKHKIEEEKELRLQKKSKSDKSEISEEEEDDESDGHGKTQES